MSIIKGLDDEVGDNPPIVGVHPRSIGVEYADNTDIHLILAMIVHHQGFGYSLAFIITAPESDAADVSPIGLRLWVHGWISVYL